MAREMGLGVVPYSPLAGGVLTGKYSRDDLTATNVASGDGTRKSFNFALGTLTERNLAIADVLKEVATELGHTPAQVGLAWTLRNPSVTAPIIGARTPAQLESNIQGAQRAVVIPGAHQAGCPTIRCRTDRYPEHPAPGRSSRRW